MIDTELLQFIIALFVLVAGMAGGFAMVRAKTNQNSKDIADLKSAMDERIGGLRDSVNRKIDKLDEKIDRREDSIDLFREETVQRISHLEAKTNGKR